MPFLFHIRIILISHLSDVAMICETIVAIITDDDMFMDREAHHSASEYQLAGDGYIFGGRLRVPGGMIMGKYEGRGFVLDSRTDHLSGIDTAGGQGPFGVSFGGNNPIFGIQENNCKILAGFVADAVIKIIKESFGVIDRILFNQLLFQKSIRHRFYQLQPQSVFRTDAVDIKQFVTGRFKDALQGLELFQRCLCGILAVLARRCESQ